MTTRQIHKFVIVILAMTRRFRRRYRPFVRAGTMAAALSMAGCITDPAGRIHDDECLDPSAACSLLVDEDDDGYPVDTDCNDANPLIYPGARYDEDSDEYQSLAALAGPEGLDYNCDGVSDLPMIIVNHAPDEDGDGYVLGEDCNDQDPLVHPGANYATDSTQWAELTARYPDGFDYNCDGQLDNSQIIGNMAPDQDGDGYTVLDDCNDQDALIFPGAQYELDSPEIQMLRDKYADTGVDYDCDGENDLPMVVVNPMPDSDGDGYIDDVDCRPENPLVHPGASHDEGSDEEIRLMQLCIWDYDCDGEPDIEPFTNCFPDGDGDGYPEESFGVEADCDDSNPLIHPDASYEEGSDEWSSLLVACQNNGGELDYDCDGEADMSCQNIIING